MSARQLLRLAAILGLLLLGWGAAALARRREAAPSGDALRLPKISRTQVDTVLLSRTRDTTVLARKDSSTWTVNGKPAASSAVAEMLSALSDSTAASELVAERRSSHAGLGVDTAGTRVRIMGGGKTLAELVVGHRSPDFSGGYLRRADQDPTYMVRGQLVEALSRPSDEWRDHRVAKVAGDSIARLEISRGARRYTLSRGDKAWLVTPGGPADSSRIGDLLTAYSSVEASGFPSPAQADSARFTSPDRRARLLRKDGTAILTLLFDSTATGFWVRPDTSKTIYQVDSWTADRLAPADTMLRAKRK
jgi:hypothetical protein